MKKLLSIIILIISIDGYAQFYPLEAGVTGGLSSGLNFRAYLDESLSYEAQLSFRNEGLQFNLFRQVHEEMEMTENGTIYFVFGYGAHAGFYYTDRYNVLFREIYFGRDVFSPLLGIDGYAAIEYRMYDTPISFGLSFKPFMELSLKQIVGVNMWDFGFTFKYRFSDQRGYY